MNSNEGGEYFEEDFKTNVKNENVFLENDGEYFEEDYKTNVKIEKVYSENVGKNQNSSCEICGKHYKSKSYLKIHVQAEHVLIRYSCSQCDQRFTQKVNLKSHIQSVHEKIKYTCDRCDQQFTQQGNLKTHTSRHFLLSSLECIWAFLV